MSRILSTRDEVGRHRRGTQSQAAELQQVVRIVGVFRLSDEDAETLLSMLGLEGEAA